MRGLLFRIVAIAALVLVGCGGGPTATGPIKNLPRDPTPQEASVLRAGNGFTFRLFERLAVAEPDSNVFISPLSVSMALGMALNGAEEETYDAMARTLGLARLTLEEINASYRGLIDLLLDLDPRVETNVANSIWIRDGFPVEEAFLETNRTTFDAEAARLAFGSPEAARAINDWVSRETRGRIPTIVDQIPPNYVLYLINAVYFKGLWSYPFDPRLTRDQPFHLRDGSTRSVPLMTRDSTYLYAEVDGWKAVQLAYGGGAFAMTLLLPAEARPLESALAELDAEAWQGIIDGLQPSRVLLEIPRFELEYEKTLNDVLADLGMAIAFTPGADFGKISRGAGLWIDEVKHKTFVRVDEEGTEAAAATSVGMVTSMPPSFRADRPFVYVIRERFSGAILFIGQFVAPPRG